MLERTVTDDKKEGITSDLDPSVLQKTVDIMSQVVRGKKGCSVNARTSFSFDLHLARKLTRADYVCVYCDLRNMQVVKAPSWRQVEATKEILYRVADKLYGAGTEDSARVRRGIDAASRETMLSWYELWQESDMTEDQKDKWARSLLARAVHKDGLPLLLQVSKNALPTWNR